jgi:putative membrane protein
MTQPTPAVPPLDPNSAPRAASEPAIDVDDPRVLWAAERTLLAWIRTGLAMMGFGFLVARFGFFLREFAAVRQQVAGGDGGASPGWSLWLGTGLVLLGVAVSFLAAFEQFRLERQLFPRAGGRLPRTWLALATALILGIIGLAMAGYLVTLS